MRIAFTVALLLSALFCGCRTYVIDSHPQGLRVTVNEIERGVTPYEHTSSINNQNQLKVEVAPPSRQQLKTYEEQNAKIVSTWITNSQTKLIYTPTSPSGRVLFNFIEREYDRPTTEEEWEWVRNAIKDDEEFLRRQEELKKHAH